MNTPDITPLVKGALMIVLLSIALGQYGAVENWARTHAFEAIAWKEPLPYFFGTPGARTHRREIAVKQAGKR